MFGTDNLFVASSAAFATAHAYSPTFTILALARRIGAHIAQLHATRAHPQPVSIDATSNLHCQLMNDSLRKLAAPHADYKGRGADYAYARPDYPHAAIDLIPRGLGDPARLVVADVGAGTGIGSRLLADRGARVTAVEPSASMREAAEPHARVIFRDAAAEHTPLSKASVDLVTCFQAFHWFKPGATLGECRRMLKPGGRLAVAWNRNVPDDEFLADFRRIVSKARPGAAPGNKHRAPVQSLMSDPRFDHVRRHKVPHSRALDLPGLIGYAQSKSYVPREGQAHRQLIADLRALHGRWADASGEVHFALRTIVYLAEAGAPRDMGQSQAIARTRLPETCLKMWDGSKLLDCYGQPVAGRGRTPFLTSTSRAWLWRIAMPVLS
ncbi:MAG: methyltransferase domain-containing protein [Gammaproteobacteria bacterium]|nr:methyltransferase domain-containing protein [Gammaproteobacteria bacterium]